MGAASLVLGIIAVVLSLFFPVIAAIVGVIGIILGALAKKKAPSGVATAGLVLSIIGTALAVALYLACVACIAAADSAVNDAFNALQ